MDLLTAIALLCQIHSGASSDYMTGQIQSMQASCQAKLARCVVAQPEQRSDKTALLTCVKDR